MTSETRRRGLDLLLDSYSVYYDITRIDGGCPEAVAEFHSRGEKYLLSRSVNLWSVEDHEYVFFFSVPTLGAGNLERFMGISLSKGMDGIHPSSEHRSSMVTTIIICDDISQSATKEIKRHTYHRSFRMTLHGWMDHRVVAVCPDSGEIVSDRLGREITDMVSRSVGNSDTR